jgi:succinate dehydrogenase/fumarate reductase flavoprotein subunit
MREELVAMCPERDVDVLVVGSGAAGLAAALSARESGVQFYGSMS